MAVVVYYVPRDNSKTEMEVTHEGQSSGKTVSPQWSHLFYIKWNTPTHVNRVRFKKHVHNSK